MDQIDRRQLLKSGGCGFAALGVSAPALTRATDAAAAEADARAFGLVPNARTLQTAALQRAIDATSRRGAPLRLPPGRFWTGALTLPDRVHVVGAGETTVLAVSETADG
ncbi:MAG: TIGR03808 family TAT-translocated repetitive protein, partial [Pseudomonadota bacterium]